MLGSTAYPRRRRPNEARFQMWTDTRADKIRSSHLESSHNQFSASASLFASSLLHTASHINIASCTTHIKQLPSSSGEATIYPPFPSLSRHTPSLYARILPPLQTYSEADTDLSRRVLRCTSAISFLSHLSLKLPCQTVRDAHSPVTDPEENDISSNVRISTGFCPHCAYVSLQDFILSILKSNPSLRDTKSYLQSFGPRARSLPKP